MLVAGLRTRAAETGALVVEDDYDGQLQGLGAAYATGAATHPLALVVCYGTPPDSGFATAVNLLCAVLG